MEACAELILPTDAGNEDRMADENRPHGSTGPAEFPFGPWDPDPLSAFRTELVREGKHDGYVILRGVDAAHWVMPPQRIETADDIRRRSRNTTCCRCAGQRMRRAGRWKLDKASAGVAARVSIVDRGCI